ncbi:3-dehydroquinate synthase [Pacificimonas sp. WHA3]|uniref:3-dehydroquinate synthase n=1 Tax=Pacificimonas pallii TaxID=2827236 RepID=A0ABS6SGH9_9SPHN|nr:3-dehydroquinate synthase [Pacificimonas pallii]MBV7257519.1 3-dehydroquinate synthase [Pacificimonas pallii]
MTRIDVALGGRSYPILIESGLLSRAGQSIAAPGGGRAQVIVTDQTVAAHHLDGFLRGLDRPSETIVLAAGEATKSWANLEILCEQLLSFGVERGDNIIALGGGVIGDLTGFAASIIRRGCQFVQVPTTLLAQVDSSVGGKTAINSRAGKNLVGAFHQPSLVLIDPDVLTTLPARELRAGYAEVAKYGLIGDAPFFDWCERNAATLLAGDTAALTEAIAVSCRSKAAVVAADERETDDMRALLNLGHTFGHALEAEGGYSGDLLHGEAVAIGMILAFRYSARRGLCGSADADRVADHFAAHDMAVAIPGFARDPDRLIGHMRQDKKARGGQVPLILARGIGKAFVAHDVDLADVRAFLAEEIAKL